MQFYAGMCKILMKEFSKITSINLKNIWKSKDRVQKMSDNVMGQFRLQCAKGWWVV